MATDTNQPSFEQAFSELRETVQTLEAGNLPLDEATRLFEKGIRLAKTCNELLSSAELKVTKLQRSFHEQLTPIPAAEEASLDADSRGLWGSSRTPDQVRGERDPQHDEHEDD